MWGSRVCLWWLSSHVPQCLHSVSVCLYGKKRTIMWILIKFFFSYLKLLRSLLEEILTWKLFDLNTLIYIQVEQSIRCTATSSRCAHASHYLNHVQITSVTAATYCVIFARRLHNNAAMVVLPDASLVPWNIHEQVLHTYDLWWEIILWPSWNTNYEMWSSYVGVSYFYDLFVFCNCMCSICRGWLA
jgi:hypothetical protein